MLVIKTEVKGYLIQLFEEPEAKQFFGRSVYNMRIEHPEHGMYIVGIGDDMEEALLYHSAHTKLAMEGKKVF